MWNDDLPQVLPDEQVSHAPFVWTVPSGGWRWEDVASHPGGEFPGTWVGLDRHSSIEAVPDSPVTKVLISSGDAREYRPLEVAGLFWEFASTPCTNDAILTFANKYGTLGVCRVEQPLWAYAADPVELWRA